MLPQHSGCYSLGAACKVASTLWVSPSRTKVTLTVVPGSTDRTAAMIASDESIDLGAEAGDHVTFFEPDLFSSAAGLDRRDERAADLTCGVVD